jgi:uncharacterized protein Veg
MIRKRFDKIKNDFKGDDPVRVLVGEKIMISRVHGENRYGIIKEVYGASFDVKMEVSGKIYRIDYRYVDPVDSAGEIIEDIMRDRLGQVLRDGDIVAVSTKYGAMEICKVERVSHNRSELTVRVWFRGHQETLSPHKCLRLPVDETLLMATVLNGFQPLVVED